MFLQSGGTPMKPTEEKIVQALADLATLCPGGYVAGLQIGFHAPDFLFQTYPGHWMERYSDEGLILSDPIVAWGMSNVGTRRWSAVPEAEANPVMTQAATQGLIYGVVTGISGSTTRSLCAAARADREYSYEEIAKIGALFQELHDLTDGLETLGAGTCAQLRDTGVDVTAPEGPDL